MILFICLMVLILLKTFSRIRDYLEFIILLDYFEFIIKKHETLTEKPPVHIYPNKTKNRIVFNIKTGYKLQLSSETMKLLGSIKKEVDQDKDGEAVPK